MKRIILCLTCSLFFILPSHVSAQTVKEWINTPYQVVDISSATAEALRVKPGGKILIRDGTGFAVTGKYWVVQKKGKWLGVYSWVAKNNRLLWIDGDNIKLVSEQRTKYRKAVVSRSQKTVKIYEKGKHIYTANIAVGRPGSPSPLGKTSVESIHRPWDVGVSSKYYGRWIIALGMWQPYSSPGFPNGGAMAFHGTSNPNDIGKARSAGCFRMRANTLQKLKELLPEGTPIWIVY